MRGRARLLGRDGVADSAKRDLLGHVEEPEAHLVAPARRWVHAAEHERIGVAAAPRTEVRRRGFRERRILHPGVEGAETAAPREIVLDHVGDRGLQLRLAGEGRDRDRYLVAAAARDLDRELGLRVARDEREHCEDCTERSDH